MPFIKMNFPDGHRLYQDNDPKHTSITTKAWMADNGVNWWPTPPESPVSVLEPSNVHSNIKNRGKFLVRLKI